MSWLFSILIASSIMASDPNRPIIAFGPDTGSTSVPVVTATDETERFEQTYPLSGNGRVSVSNINGSITIETWDAEQVKIEVVKTADTKERLNDAEVKIESDRDSFEVRTEYGKLKNRDGWNRTTKLVVDYRLTVPRNAVLDEIETVNGSINVTDAYNVTKAKAVNGQVRGTGLRGTAELSTVNGQVIADFDQIDGTGTIELNTVNGQVNLTLPSDVNATVKADTVNGKIANEFGLPVRKGKYIGRDLYGRIGSGQTNIKLNSINGELSIKRKADGRTPNPVVDLLPQKPQDDPENADNEAKIEAKVSRSKVEMTEALEEARKEIEKARPEIEKAAAEAMKRSAETIEASKEFLKSEEFKELRENAERLRREMRERMKNVRFVNGPPVIEKKTGRFDVKGVPTVKVDAGEAEVSIRGWDKDTVDYSVTRVSETRVAKPLEVSAEQTGNVVAIRFDDSRNDCAGCEFAAVRIEVSVPRKSNLKIVSGGEIRLENVSGAIDVEGGDEAVNLRDIDGRLSVKNGDGRVRVIGFRGIAEAVTADGEISLEGDLQSLYAKAEDGTIMLTLPSNVAATIVSNTRSVESTGVPLAFEQSDADRFIYKMGNGGPQFSFEARDGRLIVREASRLVGEN